MDKIHNFRRGKSGRKIEKLPYERSDGLFSTARKKLMRPAHSIKKWTTGKKPPMAGQKYICNHHRRAFSVVRTISQRIRQGYSAIADFGECAAAIRPRSAFFQSSRSNGSISSRFIIPQALASVSSHAMYGLPRIPAGRIAM